MLPACIPSTAAAMANGLFEGGGAIRMSPPNNLRRVIMGLEHLAPAGLKSSADNLSPERSDQGVRTFARSRARTSQQPCTCRIANLRHQNTARTGCVNFPNHQAAAHCHRCCWGHCSWLVFWRDADRVPICSPLTDWGAANLATPRGPFWPSELLIRGLPFAV
jgi:hypothetical protein